MVLKKSLIPSYFVIMGVPISIIGPFIKILNIKISDIYYIFLLPYIIIKVIFYFYKCKKSNANKSIIFIILFLLIFCFYSLASIIWSVNYNESYEAFKWILSGSAITLSIILTINKNNFNIFMKVIFYLYLIICINSIYEILTGNYYFSRNESFIFTLNPYLLHYPLSFFTNSNDLAFFLVIFLPFIINYLLNKKNCLINIMMLIIIVAAIFIILNTNSRLTYITIALMVISLLIYNLIKINLLNLSRFLAICFGIFLAYLIIRNLDPTILYKEINSILEMNSNSDFYAARAQIIKKGLVYFWNGNFIGLGAGGSMSLLRIPMHNIFLGILVDYGIFIFIYFIAVIGYTLYQLIIIYNEIKYSFEYKFYVLSCIFNILVMPLTMSISSDAISRKYTWVLFGIIFLFIKIYKEEIISLRQNKLNQKQYFFNKSRK
ncbi:MAG: hypothetical protein NUV45_13315 [Tepidanaerobacteraceae bacterium]|nr:hypothetical protein [Tepidanaerobacteraceae bacterium]